MLLNKSAFVNYSVVQVTFEIVLSGGVFAALLCLTKKTQGVK